MLIQNRGANMVKRVTVLETRSCVSCNGTGVGDNGQSCGSCSGAGSVGVQTIR